MGPLGAQFQDKPDFCFAGIRGLQGQGLQRPQRCSDVASGPWVPFFCHSVGCSSQVLGSVPVSFVGATRSSWATRNTQPFRGCLGLDDFRLTLVTLMLFIFLSSFHQVLPGPTGPPVSALSSDIPGTTCVTDQCQRGFPWGSQVAPGEGGLNRSVQALRCVRNMEWVF